MRNFYLGGFQTARDCFQMIEAEEEAASEHGDEFWTNRSFTYGGRKQNGWIRHYVIGGTCQKANPASSENNALDE